MVNAALSTTFAKIFGMTGIIHLHSAFRYLVLLFIIVAIVDAVVALTGDKAYGKSSRILALLALITTHIQLLMGLFLYFLGDKGVAMFKVEDFMTIASARFFAVEHITGMLAAITLVTIGYSRAKRATVDKKKYKTIATYFGLALILIFAMIPWPFMKAFGSWI